MLTESELDYSSNSDSELDENICTLEEQEEFKYVNLGWPQNCSKCQKLVAEKYCTTKIIFCKPCYNNRTLEINSVEEEKINIQNVSLETQKNSSLITINCELELAK